MEFSEMLDSKGPFQTAKLLNCDPEVLFKTVSPVETSVLRWFEEHEVITEGDALFNLMRRIGKEKLDYLKQIDARVTHLHVHAKVIEIEGHRFVDATCIDRTDNPTLGLEIYSQDMSDEGVIVGTITNDDRGDGLCLFRRNDNPVLDFSKIEGMSGVKFAHKNGFVAKLDAGANPQPLVAASICKPSLWKRIAKMLRLAA
jgi:hypothetical protein